MKKAKKSVSAAKPAGGRKKRVARKKKKVARKKPLRTDTVPPVDSRDLAMPVRLFDKQRVAIVGRFSHNPEKSQITKFLRQEGASVVSAINKNLDILIVEGKGSAAKVKQAKKLNTAGASIRIITDLHDLWDINQLPMKDVLNSQDCIGHLADVLERTWFVGEIDPLVGEDFSKAQLGRLEFNSRLEDVEFIDCNFTKARICRLDIGNYDCQPTRCDFTGARFQDSIVRDAAECTFDGVSGSGLELVEPTDSSFRKVTLKDSILCGLASCTLEGCKIENTEFDSHDRDAVIGSSTIRSTKFLNTKVIVSRRPQLIDGSKLEQVEFNGGAFNSGFVFSNCSLKDVKFTNLNISALTFSACKLQNCSFTQCSVGQTHFEDSQVTNCKVVRSDLRAVAANAKQLKGLVGVDAKSARDLSRCPKLKQLADAFEQATALSFNVCVQTVDDRTVGISAHKSWASEFSWGDKKEGGRFSLRGEWERELVDYQHLFFGLFRVAPVASVDPETLKASSSNCQVKGKELKQLIVDAVCEANGVEPPSEDDVNVKQQARRKAKATARESVRSELAAGLVKQINGRSAVELAEASPLRKMKLAGKSLKGIKLPGVDLGQSDFSNADLTAANLKDSGLSKVDFSAAMLRRTNLTGANLKGANLTNADLSAAKLRKATLKGACFSGAILTGASLTNTDLSGVDLSSSTLKDTLLRGAMYDDKTKLPKSVTIAIRKQMRWRGGGLPPHERKQNKKKGKGPLDFGQFMARLDEITDSARLSKSLKMLKADAFQLFSEVNDQSVVGVVKSQTDTKLVYSCMLNSNGQFTCCTQNLNSCGGLRGAICKHILVLVVGLAKNGTLDPAIVDEWVNSSKQQDPSLDKDRMGEILLKYKGAEAGEIDWRPTETVPEDFFAF